jgi:aspartokinase-like uncharacterized kinase
MCLPNTVLYTASEHLYSVQSAVNDLKNVSDYVVMDTLKNCRLLVQVHWNVTVLNGAALSRVILCYVAKSMCCVKNGWAGISLR